MKKYKTIDELHQAIEKKADKIIKHYYSDFKNYDRPAIMKHTGEKTKEVYLILREAGSYLFSAADLLDIERDYPVVVMNYYTNDTTAHYFKIDFSRFTLEEIPAGLPKEIKAERARLEKIAA